MEIDPKYKTYYLLDNEKGHISLFTCPVEGCGFQTDQGPGALRMHLIIRADPGCKGRYCKEHEQYVAAHPETIKGVSPLSSKVPIGTPPGRWHHERQGVNPIFTLAARLEVRRQDYQPTNRPHAGAHDGARRGDPA